MHASPALIYNVRKSPRQFFSFYNNYFCAVFCEHYKLPNLSKRATIIVLWTYAISIYRTYSIYFYDCRIVKETLLFMMPSVKREMICLPCCWITIWLTSWSQTTTGLTHFTMQLCEEIQGRRNFCLIYSFNDGRKYT